MLLAMFPYCVARLTMCPCVAPIQPASDSPVVVVWYDRPRGQNSWLRVIQEALSQAIVSIDAAVT